MSTASGLSTEDHASNLFGTKGGGGLEALFTPQNIAVIGATEKAGSIGRMIVWNLIKSPFGGTVFPVNPKRPRVLGIKAYPRIGDLLDPIDLSIVAKPAPMVPDLTGERHKPRLMIPRHIPDQEFQKPPSDHPGP